MIAHAPRTEAGFTLIEVLIAIFVLLVGVLALAATLDSSRALTTKAEKVATASTIAEREMERIRSLPYAAIALTAAPAVTSDPTNPDSAVSTTCPSGATTCFRWEQSGASGATEPLVVDAANGDTTANPQTWSAPSPSGGTRLTGRVYRYVTWVDDAQCTTASCAGTTDYKRVSVAVTVNGVKRWVLLTSFIRPSAAAAGNPLTFTGTTCLDATGTQVPCVS